MRYVEIPGTELRVSMIGLGCNAFGERADREASLAIVDRALDAGVTLLDTADMYCEGRSEEILGEALKGRRDRVVLATKGGGVARGIAPGGGSRKYLTHALEASLRRLRTDYVDLYYVHYFDPATPGLETLETLDELRRAGKIRAIGVSNYSAWQVCKSLWTSERAGLIRVACVQASYSLVDRTTELEMLPLCIDQQIGLWAFWPLGGGILTGKYRANEPPPDTSRILTQPILAKSFTPSRIALAERVASAAAKLRCTPAQLALAWVLSRPGVTGALIGATKVSQLEDNVGAMDVVIPEELARELEDLSAEARWTPFR